MAGANAFYRAMVEDKDIVSTVTTGGLALSGLLLVFVGFGLRDLRELLESGQRQRFSTRIRFLRIAVAEGAGIVIIGVINAALGVGWLLGWDGLYGAVVADFFVVLALTVVIALGILFQAMS